MQTAASVVDNSLVTIAESLVVATLATLTARDFSVVFPTTPRVARHTDDAVGDSPR